MNKNQIFAAVALTSTLFLGACGAPSTSPSTPIKEAAPVATNSPSPKAAAVVAPVSAVSPADQAKIDDTVAKLGNNCFSIEVFGGMLVKQQETPNQTDEAKANLAALLAKVQDRIKVLNCKK